MRLEASIPSISGIFQSMIDLIDGYVLVGKGARISAGCSASYRFHRWGIFIKRFSKAHSERIQHQVSDHQCQHGQKLVGPLKANDLEDPTSQIGSPSVLNIQFSVQLSGEITGFLLNQQVSTYLFKSHHVCEGFF